VENNVDFDAVWLGILARLVLFEGFVLTEGPAAEAHAMWMRDWPISWQGGWSRSLQSLVCLDFLWACFCEHGQTSDT